MPRELSATGDAGASPTTCRSSADSRRQLPRACDDTEVLNPQQMREMIEQWNAASDNPRINRSPEELARFFEGLELLDPGVVSVSQWRPSQSGEPTAEVDDFGGVARKQ